MPESKSNDPTAGPINREDLNLDLGLGGRLTNQSLRSMNQDGSFNVDRYGTPKWEAINLYHLLLTISWYKFLGLVVVAYLLVNTFYAIGYMLCGHGAVAGVNESNRFVWFLECFFFSVQTLVTIGYGKMTPEGIPANLLVAVEALSGLMGFALATGLLFARFSRPIARLRFSRNAVVAPFLGGKALMFRLANSSSNELAEVRARVTLLRFEERDGKRARKFHQLSLERERVTFLPVQWVVVHPIDEASPFFGQTEEEVIRSQPEIMVLISAIDETFMQTVHSRFSYRLDEIIYGAKFRDVYETGSGGIVRLDVRRLDEYDPIQFNTDSEQVKNG